MPQESVVATLATLSASSCGVFRAERATALGVTPNQLTRLARQGVIERVHPCTYRMTAVSDSGAQRLLAALLWAGDAAAAAGRSAGSLYGLDGVHPLQPEIVLPHRVRGPDGRHHRLPRRFGRAHGAEGDGRSGLGCEATLLRLAHLLEPERFEVACEDARRRRLTSVPALRAYLERFGQRGRRGVAPMRRLLDELDPVHPARSALEVKTRRLLVAHGITDFVRELPLEWRGRTYRFDFAFPARQLILETNGRRWHDDPHDYEHDHEKWSIPGRLGYRIVFATWDTVVRRPDQLLADLAACRHR